MKKETAVKEESGRAQKKARKEASTVRSSFLGIGWKLCRKVGIIKKGNASNDLQHTTSDQPKHGHELGMKVLMVGGEVIIKHMVQRYHSVFQVCGITPSKPPRMAHGLGKFLYTTAQEDFPFFHAITKHGRARNKITDLLDSSCNLVEEKEELVVIATSYFRSLYEASNLELMDEALANVTTTISGRLNADLTTLVTKWEGSQGRSCSSYGFWVGDGGIDEAAEEASAQKKRVSLQRQAAVTVEAAEDYARRFESGVNELSSLSNDQVGEELAQSGVNICFIGVHGVVTPAVFVSLHRAVIFLRSAIPNGLLQDCKSLQNLSLHNNPISMDEFRLIPNGLLQDCKSLQNLSLHNNPISMDEFRLMEGLDLEDCPEKEPLGHGFYADFTMATRITIPDFITETICYILQ
ncbi:hypothetical protein DY000_02060382 [Brassica cretica]|uniref:Uncharacterized protein n=1 Tax=Brassica cretica TaxID=69181 RepID=A0ABQ7ATA8_BRACR|nr:hypothetical protein DY000_02060382 [Brassica cretica]